MKKIVVELNQASVQQAINYLKHLRKNITKMMDEFLEFACEWIINQANRYIELSDLGDLVKMDIRNNWGYVVSNGSAKIENISDKAVFVEFGVGIVGQEKPHPQSNVEGYIYNMPSESKRAGLYHDENTWRFITNDKDLIDLPSDSYETWEMASGSLKIITRGTKGVWYAYNAIVDAQMDLQNPNGAFATEWRKIKERYIV